MPMLSGFWLRPDLEVAELSIFTWPGCTAGQDLYEEVMQSLVELAEERPGAVRLIAGAPFTRGALMRPSMPAGPPSAVHRHARRLALRVRRTVE